MSHRLRTLLMTVSLLLTPSLAGALTYVAVSDGDLVDRAKLIVRAELISSRVSRETGRAMTSYEFAVLNRLKGLDPGPTVTVRVPGGIDLEKSIAVRIFGVPEFRSGQKALLLLAARADGSHRILHVFHGAFLERTVAGQSVYIRPGREASVVERAVETRRIAAGSQPLRIRAAEQVPRDRLAFEAWIRDRLDGRDRGRDYLRPNLGKKGPATARVAEFTYLVGDDLLIRWPEFDDGDRVDWHRHRDGQDGLSDGGKKAFKRARRAWKKKFSGVPIRLRDRGRTSSTSGFEISDARNTILFEDFNDTIGEDFDCEEGGVLAIGGLSVTDLIPGVFKGLAAVSAREAEIVMNDGIDCFLNGNADVAGQIYTHELGHTLGLGHSCGDRESPKCSKSELLAEAVMVASLDSIFGAEIRDDDVLAARQLYDEDFWSAACDAKAPGARGFCRKCGPCGEGQGNCRRDSDCFGTLVCTRDVGAAFGFDEDVNVCTQP